MYNLDTLFLDRDGVINIKLEDKYVQNFEEFEFIEGAELAIANLSKIFKRIIVVTNQQGIAKGIMSAEDLNSLHKNMLQQLKIKEGYIKKIYYCPHLEESDCLCRKPKPGMIENAILDFPEIVIEDSYLIGDSESDIEAGKRINLNTVRVDNEYTLAKWTAELLSVI